MIDVLNEAQFITHMIQCRDIQESILQRCVDEMIKHGYITSVKDVIVKFEPLENNVYTNSVSNLYKFYFFGDFPLRLYISDSYTTTIKLPRNLEDKPSVALNFKPVWSERVFL